MIYLILILAVLVAFIFGRKYERKQFVKIGKKQPTTQEVILRGRK